MQQFIKFTVKTSEYLDCIARWAVVAIMVLVVGNVILRLLGCPIQGTYEWAGFLSAMAIGLALAYCAVQGGHVAVTFLLDRAGSKTQVVVDLLISIISLMFLILATWEIIVYAGSIANSGEVALTTKVPLYPFVYIIAIGFLGFCLVYLATIIAAGKEIKK